MKDIQSKFAKLLAVVGALTWALCAHAGTGIVGTKLGSDYSPATSSTGSGVGFGALAQMILALCLVAFVLKWVLPKLAGKITGKKLVSSANGGIQVEETAQFAGGNLYIVSARGKTILISATGQSVTTLADLTKEVKPKVDPFEIALNEAKARPSMTAAELEARAALDRLTQLTGAHVDR